MQSNHFWRLLKQQSEISNQLYVGDLHVLHIVCTNVERNARHAIWSDVERNAVHAIWSLNGRLPVLFATGMIILSDHLVDVLEGFKQLLPLRRARLRIVIKRASCWLIFWMFSIICTYQVEHSRVHVDQKKRPSKCRYKANADLSKRGVEHHTTARERASARA